MLIFALTACVSIALYLLLVTYFIIGLSRIGETAKADLNNFPFVSVVVAFRNEADMLPQLLSSFLKLRYPLDRFEVVLVDDHSSDHGVGAIQPFFQSGLTLRLLTAETHGKKAAISLGVENARGLFIFATDADCRVHPQWLSSIVGECITHQSALVAGMVFMSSDGSFLQDFQQMDFAALQLSGLACARMGHPIMCNGANMGYSKQQFLRHRTGLKSEYSSGDDMFLLQSMKREGLKVVFSAQPESIVTTAAMPDWHGFFKQRMRWISKATGYRDRDVLAVAWIVFLTNLFMVSMAVAVFWNVVFLAFLMGCYVAKGALEWILFCKGRYWGWRFSLLRFVMVQLIHPFYTVGIVAAAMFTNVSWKGRSVKQE
jgi:cellulose synthase/poly-beta-1,6-N-acetylglucosamine synthase-like glycosyltransferase